MYAVVFIALQLYRTVDIGLQYSMYIYKMISHFSYIIRQSTIYTGTGTYLALSLSTSRRPAGPPSRTPVQTTSRIVFSFLFFFLLLSFFFFRLLASSLAASLSLDELELFDLPRAFFFFFFVLLKKLYTQQKLIGVSFLKTHFYQLPFPFLAGGQLKPDAEILLGIPVRTLKKST
jgi:hypothetical protein